MPPAIKQSVMKHVNLQPLSYVHVYIGTYIYVHVCITNTRTCSYVYVCAHVHVKIKAICGDTRLKSQHLEDRSSEITRSSLAWAT